MLPSTKIATRLIDARIIHRNSIDIILCKNLHHSLKIILMPIIVAITECDIVALSNIQGSIARKRQPTILKMQYSDSLIHLSICIANRSTIICAAIIYQNNLNIQIDL